MSSTLSNSSLFHRSLDKEYPTAVRGEGVYLITADGRRILDGSSGAAVSSVGHGNEEVIKAVCDQAHSLAFAHTSFFTSDPAEKLADLILANSDGAFSKILFLGSGSEAVESALKIARQYHVYRGETERVNIIGRVNSYHGNTLGALSMGGHVARRTPYEPLLLDNISRVSPCYSYRNRLPSETDEDYVMSSDGDDDEFDDEYVE